MTNYGRPLGFHFHQLFGLSEAKEISRALKQLRDRSSHDATPSSRAARRLFWEALTVAAADLAISVDSRVTALTLNPDTVGFRAIEEVHRGFYDPDRYVPDDPASLPTTRNLLRAQGQLLGASQTPGWRAPVKRLRHGRTSLRTALKAHPSVRYALRHGLLQSGLAERLGRRWLHRLETSPETLSEIAGLALDHEGLVERRGRPAYPELQTFVERAMTAAEAYSDKPVTATDHKDRRSKAEGITRHTSPGLALVHACVAPLYPHATLESCAGYIRTVKAQRKHTTAHN